MAAVRLWDDERSPAAQIRWAPESLALTRYLEGMLFGITPADTVTFVAVAGLFAIGAAAATLVPAKRAMNVDPLTALRYE